MKIVSSNCQTTFLTIPLKGIVQSTAVILFITSIIACAGCASLPSETNPKLLTTDSPTDYSTDYSTDFTEFEDETSSKGTEKSNQPLTFAERRANWQRFFRARFGESSGLDPRAREIERRLGF